MDKLSPEMKAGNTLRRLIQENYPSQEEFAFEYGADIRTISRYINNGISKVSTIQELADHFEVEFTDFFRD